MCLTRRHVSHARSLAIVALWCLPTAIAGAMQQPSTARGENLYRAACLACHGADGKGAPASLVGSAMRLPDFTDCRFATSEPDVDWLATIHRGGSARGLDRAMPAFDAALPDEDIQALVRYLRRFCTNPKWPHGDLNLPRALVTEKAFPENEILVTTAAPTQYVDRVETRVVYEQRIGSRSQYEVVAPYIAVQALDGWNRGLGDVSVAFKQVVFANARTGSIVSANAEATFPTGRTTELLGGRIAVFEPFASFSQTLPAGAFVHAQVGVEHPWNIPAAADDVYWRVAAGGTFASGRWGRAWSPIVEMLAHHELAFGEPVFWDVLPELHVTLSRRQHVMANGGVRMPINLRPRTATAMVSLQWEWNQDGLFSGWR